MADDEASLPVRDSDRESSATSQESLIQSTLIHVHVQPERQIEHRKNTMIAETDTN